MFIDLTILVDSHSKVCFKEDLKIAENRWSIFFELSVKKENGVAEEMKRQISAPVSMQMFNAIVKANNRMVPLLTPCYVLGKEESNVIFYMKSKAVCWYAGVTLEGKTLCLS